MRLTNPGLWLALCALTFFPFALDSFEVPHQLVLAVGALLCTWGNRAHGGALTWPVIALLTVSALTTLASSAPGLSVPALSTVTVLGALALSSNVIDLRPVVLTTWPIAAWALAQATGHDPVEWASAAHWCGGVRPFATFGHPTQLGVWMALVTVLSLEHRAKLTALVATMICVLTLSRAGWLALGVGLVMWVGLRAPNLRLRVLLVGAIGLVVPVAIVGRDALGERVANFFTAPTRVHLLTTAWHGFLQHPLLGWGLDAFVLVDQQYRHPDAWRYEWGGTATHAHSFVPQVLATQGLVGALVMAVLVILVLRRWWQQRAHERRAAELAMVLALAAASMVGFSGVPLSALGVLSLINSLALPAVRTRLGRPLAVLGLVVSLAMSAASVAGREALGREGDVAQVQRWLSVASTLEPWNALWPTRLGAALEWNAREGRGDFAPARAAYEAGVALAPGLAMYEANAGRAASEAFDAPASRRWFDAARHHAPLDARIARDAAEASQRVGDDELADATLTSTLGFYPSDGPAWLTLAALRLKQQRPVEARAALEAAVAADWRDWPQGVDLARFALVQLVNEGGDHALAVRLANSPAPVSVPAEICGAPAFLGVRSPSKE